MAESDVSEIGYAYKLQNGIHGDLIASSVCNVWNYRVAEFWGGWNAWERFYQAGHAQGIEVGHWVGMHLSPHAPILKEHPEFICHHANTLPHGGGYCFNLCYGLNWNKACDWLLDQFAQWKRHGLDYLWLDSVGNMGLMGVDYQAHMQANAEGIFRFVGGLNRLGIRAIGVEGVSPLGVARYGVFDNMTENKRAVDSVAGQNDWSWWVGHEDMLVNTTPAVVLHPNRTEQEIREQRFRTLANRALLRTPEIGSHAEADAWPANVARHGDVFHVFNRLAPLMHKRHLLPDGKGVLWQSKGDDKLLFAFKTFVFPLEQGDIVESVTGSAVSPVATNGVLNAQPCTAYRITPGQRR
ncbi:MAG: hypothetical protein IT440_15320 [Phycisphaeraceae bacterium]|nr:hypothetical protein [Phycisphaeraceae bacterium]